jgi:hypothetical protein
MNTRAPRTLPYRFYYKWYAMACAVVWLLCAGGFTLLLMKNGWTWQGESREELLSFASMLFLVPALYLWWLHPKLTQTVQVYADHVRVSTKEFSWEIAFNDIMAIELPFHSMIRLRMKDGHSWWFSAALERSDYLWEGLMRARPELIGGKDGFEDFRLKLVQYDHHEKRKEWFFRHRLLDVLNWVVLPALALVIGYQVQADDVVINSKALYFFRLSMYSFLVTIVCAFGWSVVLKKFVFDKMVKKQMEEGTKLRDLVYEDRVIQRAKWFQVVTCALVLSAVVKSDLNLFSLTKLRLEAKAFKLVPGKTIVIDNRFNCVSCAHAVNEGDLLLFGRGTIGQVLALPGEVIAQTRSTSLGRSIASETVMEVPEGHIALKTGADGKEVVLVRIGDLVGKLKTP